ncbi:hypothetical protein [Kibdelosporangium persicum]|uniref:YobI family P-loop NTPase n=1 Tax=Kibdelosporangium persicum TaxID=2698649 RepID=UPI0015654680|nr:hypothetical protein [Kibdelosporangium persicum]
MPEQHVTYLRHLQEAVEKPKNLNIALTGRYGTGKSSVLDEFEVTNKNKTLRIAISTLGPNSEGVTLTNRIQKELVKQLLYRAAPRKFAFSRFNRIVPLSRKRAAVEASIAVGVVGSILALLGWLPAVAGTGPGQHWLVRVLSWLAFAALVVIVLAALRRTIYGRFVLSDVSAAGAAVKLTQRTSTYFDEYLEEIVYFFDEVSPDIVIFEDLDRFDDPHIFEALRELNTLLNHTAKRHRKGEPLRFIYAIKDSLFERLGSDSTKLNDDAATAETARANRTKFFDVVIPLVPFISHRNARELLADLLKASGFTGIDRSLVTLVAQHATDMRLLRNICNEYAVFAERLLTSGKTAPGLSASILFALVAYKNFHLEDFEEISRRNSDLDVLYDRRRELVRTAIDACEARKRDLLNEPTRHKSMASMAEQLGDRLQALGMAVKAASSTYPHWPHVQFSVGSARHSRDQMNSYQFWAAVAETRAVSILACADPNGSQHAEVGKLSRSQIQALFPEALDANRWVEIDEIERQSALKSLDEDITFLRGADFMDLARESRFTVSTEDGDKTFASVIDATMKSRLAQDLVKQGYLDRNFALYAAQFYGDFTGIDVANFIVQSVQTNTMDIDYTFSGPEAIANLLAETTADFSRTVSAYNIEIVDYLLQQNDDRAVDVADTIASNFGDAAQAFLAAYLNSGSERARFAALLSKRPWPGVFTYLVQDEGIPADVRPALVDAALRDAVDGKTYELGPEVRDFIVANYLDMAVFTSHQDDAVADKVVALIKKAGVILPGLAGLDEAIRNRVVHEHLYLLTADNLREALGVTGDVSFDRVCQNADVYALCRRRPNEYLAAVENDSHTPYSVLTETTLAEVLPDVAETWDIDHVRELIAMAAPDSRLERLDSAPPLFWPDLAAHRLFRSTLRNVRAYRDSLGSIDQSLADLLVQTGSIDDAGEDATVRLNVAIDVLNATDTIPEARQRVNLVVSLQLDHYISPGEIKPEAGDFLALLLEHDLVDDSLESFAQFRTAGWEAIEPAIAKSENFVEFMTPELINGFVKDLLGSHVVPGQACDKVVDNLAQYVPGNDTAALSAAGRYAFTRGRTLPLDQVRRVATATRDKNLTLQLLAAASPMPAPEVVAVLTELGEPYSNLISRATDEFDVPADETHRTVFDHLREAGIVADFRKRRLKDVFVVKLT